MTILFKKHFFLSGLLILSAFIIKAQQFSIGAKTGMTSSKFVSNSQNSFRNTFYFGVIANKRFNRTYSLQAEINFSSKGSNTNGLQTIPDLLYNEFNLSPNTTYYGSYKKETILNNIEIPLLAKVELPINIHFRYYMLAGPYVGIVNKGKSVTSGSSNVYEDIAGQIPADETKIGFVSFDNAWNSTKEFRKFTIGAEGGIGISYGHPCKPVKIFIEGRFAINISNIQKSISFDKDKNQESLNAALGFLYKL